MKKRPVLVQRCSSGWGMLAQGACRQESGIGVSPCLGRHRRGVSRRMCWLPSGIDLMLLEGRHSQTAQGSPLHLLFQEARRCPPRTTVPAPEAQLPAARSDLGVDGLAVGRLGRYPTENCRIWRCSVLISSWACSIAERPSHCLASSPELHWEEAAMTAVIPLCRHRQAGVTEGNPDC